MPSQHTHTTNGNVSLRSVDTAVINRDLDLKRDERSCLLMRLWEVCPSHPVFKKVGFNKDMDDLSETLENAISQAILYRATRQQINCFHVLIQEIETDSNTREACASLATPEAPNGTPPPNSGSAAPSCPAAWSSSTVDDSGVVQGL